MVEMRLDPDLAGRGQQIDQFGVEQPLRQRDRHAGADADHVHMVDRGQLGDEPAQLGDRQRQRIAARDDHVADRFGVSRTYWIIRSSLWLGASQPSRSMVTRLRVQNRQYMLQTGVVTSSARSG